MRGTPTPTTMTASTTASGGSAGVELERLRARLSHREDRARVRAEVRARRATRRATQRQETLRRGAVLAGEQARTRHEVAQSGEARAMRVERTRSWALAVLLPVLLAFGGWSTAGVQAGMVALLHLESGSAAAAAAWLVEPALLGIVAGVIVIRARLQSAGGDLDGRATTIEFTALSASVVLNAAGHWPGQLDGAGMAALAGHALGPLGAAGAAYLIGVVQDGITQAQPWTLNGAPAPSLATGEPTSPPTSEAPLAGASDTTTRAPRAVPVAWPGSAPTGVTLLPLVSPAGRPRSTSEKSPRSASEQREAAGSREAGEQGLKSAARPRSDKGSTLPRSAKRTAEKSARALSDAQLVELLTTAIADARLSGEPSVNAVQKCLSIGFERAKRVLALQAEHTQTAPSPGLSVVEAHNAGDTAQEVA